MYNDIQDLHLDEVFIEEDLEAFEQEDSDEAEESADVELAIDGNELFFIDNRKIIDRNNHTYRIEGIEKATISYCVCKDCGTNATIAISDDN